MFILEFVAYDVYINFPFYASPTESLILFFPLTLTNFDVKQTEKWHFRNASLPYVVKGNVVL